MEQNEITVELQGLTEMQVAIADFLWEVDSDSDMQAVMEAFDPCEVEVVKQLMLAAMLDDIEDVSQASVILKSFTL